VTVTDLLRPIVTATARLALAKTALASVASVVWRDPVEVVVLPTDTVMVPPPIP